MLVTGFRSILPPSVLGILPHLKQHSVSFSIWNYLKISLHICDDVCIVVVLSLLLLFGCTVDCGLFKSCPIIILAIILYKILVMIEFEKICAVCLIIIFLLLLLLLLSFNA